MNSNSRLLIQPELRLKKIAAACRLALQNWPQVSRRKLTFSAGILFGALSFNMAYADLPSRMLPAGMAPVPCVTCNGGNWISSGQATFNPLGIVGNTGLTTYEIEQQTQNAILNWESFNIASDVNVRFTNPAYGADSSTLNRIYQADPSAIYGHLSSEGKLYLINRNGILFGNGAQVDTHSLIASTLNISDQIFLNGVLSAFDNTTPAFAAFQDANGNSLPSSEITVEHGAVIQSGTNGVVAIFAPVINQHGSIQTKDGQAILAAGNKVYLTGSQDPGLRGWVVEVDVDEVSDQQLNEFKSNPQASLPAGTVNNTGLLEALRGNISMVGLAINQQGMVHATTAVGGNGTVILKARDGVVPLSGGYNSGGARDGRVTFGATSHTLIDNDIEKAALTATDSEKPQPSTIAVVARQIHLEGGSELHAVGGQVELRAQDSSTTQVDPAKFVKQTDEQGAPLPIPFVDVLLGQQNTQSTDQVVADARIQLDAGSRIDVSGDAIVLPMSRNELQVDLYSNVLSGSPLQRDGILYGQTVHVDVRDIDANGQIPIADLSGALDSIAKHVDEHTTRGGTVTLNSQGSVDFSQDATIDVSGGSITYQDGYIATTRLTANGRVYDIGTADPNLIYDGIVGQVSRNYARWGVTRTWNVGGLANQLTFYRGYVDGQDAGTVNIAGHGMILNGTLLAHTTNGENQRQPADQARGGQLFIGLTNGIGVPGGILSYRAPNLNIGEFDPADLAQIDPEQLANQAYLSTKPFEQGGFTGLHVYSDGVISNQKVVLDKSDPAKPVLTLAEGSALHLAPGAEVDLNAEQIRLMGDITSPGGKISATSRASGLSVTGHAASNALAMDAEITGPTQLVLGDNVTLSVAGQWINDREGVAQPIPTDPLYINGGSITLDGGKAETLYLGKNATLDVQGGAWLDVNNKLTPGHGGSINIAMADPNTLITAKAVFAGNLQLQGYALRDGGKLNLTMAGFDINGDQTAASRAAQAAAWQQRQVVSGRTSSAVTPLTIPSTLFSDNGFSRITLNSNSGDIDIAANTIIAAQQVNRILDNTYASRHSASALPEFSQIDLLEPHLRQPVDLQFNIKKSTDIDPGRASISLGKGAEILASPGARIGMSNNSGGAIDIQGSIIAPGGVITMENTHTNHQFFDTNHRITLHDAAVLSTAGTFIVEPNTSGWQRGRVLDGGIVSLDSNGYVDLQAGSRIDVSGTSGVIDLPQQNGQIAPTMIGSNAGSIELASHQGITTNGQLIGAAGTAQQRGGGLTLSLDSDNGGNPVNEIPIYNSYNPYLNPALSTDPQRSLGRTIEISQDASVQSLESGMARISVAQLRQGGFDRITFNAEGQQSFADSTGLNHSAVAAIAFNGNIDLRQDPVSNQHTFESIILNSQRVVAMPGTEINADAHYLRFGSDEINATAPVAGSAQANFSADLIDIYANSTWEGFDSLTLASRGELRFRSDVIRSLPGEFRVSGTLNLLADQLYPTTKSDNLVSSDSIYIGSVAGTSPGNNPLPLSAGGRLRLDGTHIEIDGIVRAPLGDIDIGAGKYHSTEDLAVTSHGYVSTSLEGQSVLFGRLLSNQWYYTTQDNADEPNQIDVQAEFPVQNIRMHANSIDMQAGATINVSGGGDLLAWDYLPLGKLYDPLAATNAGGYFAILPARPGQYAPYDPQEFLPYDPEIIRDPKDPQPSFFIRPGDAVYLSGGGGVTAGTYAILPARYALLPGAILVQEITTSSNGSQGASGSLPDGTPVVAGYHTVLNSGATESLMRSFALHPGSYAYKLAEYSLTSATDYLRNNNRVGQRTPLDAGTLNLTPQDTLTLNGGFDSTPAAGGRGGEVNIDSANIDVVTQRGIDVAGQVQLVASELTGLNAESILLGGLRVHGDSNEMQVHTNTLTLADGVDLHGSDLILAARQQLAIGDNVTITATSSHPTAQAGDWHTDSTSAVIRVSAGDQMTLVRDPDGNGTPQISIGTGSILSADRSILVDTGASSSSVDLTNKLQFNTTTTPVTRSLTLSTNQLHLNNTGANLTGINVSTANLNALAVNNMVLQGRTMIDAAADTTQVFDVDGNRTTELHADLFRIDTANLQGMAGQHDILTFSAGDLTFVNSGADASGDLVTGDATLKLQADRSIVLGQTDSTDANSTLRIDGFGLVKMDVTQGDITGVGATTLQSSGDVTLTSSRLTGQSGSEFTINAAGKRVTIADNLVAPTSASDQLGAKLNIESRAVVVDGNIELHSGVVNINTSGETTADAIKVNGTIDVSGIDKTFAELTVGTAGGSVVLTAQNGAVTTTTGSALNVSGATAGSDAGSVRITTSQGNSDLQGQLLGDAATGYHSGTFRLDSQTQTGTFSDLNNSLNAGGFHGERSVRLRGAGDINVLATDTVQAERISLTADQGAVQVAGTLDASGSDGGAIALNARNAVTVTASGSLDAHATATDGNGGRIAINSVSGGIYLDGTVNVTHDTAGNGRDGKLSLRMAREAILNNQLRMNTAGIQAEIVELEGVARYDLATVAGSLTPNTAWADQADTFLSSATAITTNLGLTQLQLRAGIEAYYDGSIGLNSVWDLHNTAWRVGDTPINVTLRAADNLNITQSISDGFNGATPTAALLDQTSSTFTLVAGADLNSADTIATTAGKGNVTVSANTLVRTGDGDITVAAGNDIKLSAPTSVIYTAGRPDVVLNSAVTGAVAKNLPAQGGDVTLHAGGNIIATGNPADSSQLFTEWMLRQNTILPYVGRGTAPGETAGWWIDFANFRQGFAAFGGGDLRVAAGGDINRASFSVPTTGYYDVQTNSAVHSGKGKLVVHADGDINSAIFFVGDGTGEITSNGALTDSQRTINGESFGNVFAVMGGGISVRANGDIKAGLAINPTLLDTTGTTEPYFFTYGPDSTLALNSLAGSIALVPNSYNTGFSNLDGDRAKGYLPTNLLLEADSGDITFDASTTLFPAAVSQIRLLADRSITAQLTMSNTSPDDVWDFTKAAAVTSVAGPGVKATFSPSIDLLPAETNTLLRAIPPLHQNDPEPVWIVANHGDVNLYNVTSTKPLRVSAGRDLYVNSSVLVTHARQDEITQFTAGRDITLQGLNPYINVLGPGQLLVDAGHNVDLGNGDGIKTGGDLRYPELPDNGADITVLAGLSGVNPHYTEFLQQYSQYLTTDNAAHDRFLSYMSQLVGDPQLTMDAAMQTYLALSPQQQTDARTATALSAKDIVGIESIDQYQRQLTAYLQDLVGDPTLSREAALSRFTSLSLDLQRPMILQAFFTELRTAGRIATLPDSSAADKDYAGGYAALEALFPGSSVRNSQYHGDVNLYFSQIKTQDGGDINILVPGGIVNAGLPVEPPGVVAKKPNQLGIVAAREGSIRIYSAADIQVNQSRIFTLGGGDIMMWSSFGDIDAGRGAKSAISAPPPQLIVARDGSVTLDFAGAIAGSGIRVICTTECDDNGGFITTVKAKGPGIKISTADVDLIAPNGSVSAGEAGIGSAGNLYIAAQQVLGANNIDVSGLSVGLPVTSTVTVDAGVANAATAASASNSSDVSSVAPKEYKTFGEGATLMYLDVEVVGFGEQDDDEKRKKKQ